MHIGVCSSIDSWNIFVKGVPEANTLDILKFKVYMYISNHVWDKILVDY